MREGLGFLCWVIRRDFAKKTDWVCIWTGGVVRLLGAYYAVTNMTIYETQNKLYTTFLSQMNIKHH